MQVATTHFQQLFSDWYDTSVPTDRCSDTACKVALWIVTLITILPALILGLWAAWDHCCNRGAPEPAPALTYNSTPMPPQITPLPQQTSSPAPASTLVSVPPPASTGPTSPTEPRRLDTTIHVIHPEDYPRLRQRFVDHYRTLPDYVECNDETRTIALYREHNLVYRETGHNNHGSNHCFGVQCTFQNTFHAIRSSLSPSYIRMMERIVPPDIRPVVAEMARLRVENFCENILEQCFDYDADRGAKLFRAAYLMMQLQAYFYFNGESNATLAEIRNLLRNHGIAHIDQIITRISHVSYAFNLDGSVYSPLLELMNGCPVELRRGLYRMREYTSNDQENALIGRLRTTGRQVVVHDNFSFINIMNHLLEDAHRFDVPIRPLHHTQSDSYSISHSFLIIMDTGRRYGAFIVPTEAHKTLAIQLLNHARERGMLSEEECRERTTKIYTIPEYITHRFPNGA